MTLGVPSLSLQQLQEQHEADRMLIARFPMWRLNIRVCLIAKKKKNKVEGTKPERCCRMLQFEVSNFINRRLLLVHQVKIVFNRFRPSPDSNAKTAFSKHGFGESAHVNVYCCGSYSCQKCKLSLLMELS